jgi:glycosyltransferase involved in cell wall biosynthesis
MRIALISNHFCDGMGYLENMLPKYFGRMGHETHLITADLTGNTWLASFDNIYGDFAKSLPAGFSRTGDNHTLHVLPHAMTAGYSRIVGLGEKLKHIRPDILQTTTPIGWNTLQAARYKFKLGYKLFTGNHHHASVFPLAQKPDGVSKERMACLVKRTIPGRLVSLVTEKCYAITSDCADVAMRFFGVPAHKVEVCPLGVDTDLFNRTFLDSGRQERATLRRHLGFADTDIVCIYTGRFTDDKNPLLLAHAIDELARQGEPFRGLFVGNGPQSEAIKTCRASVTHAFVNVKELPQLFRAADIGVWPAQESMSMLDAAACGLPIVVNHTMSAPERIEGNGLTYRLNDQRDLAAVLLRLRDESLRMQMGNAGAEKMRSHFSWKAVAERRLQDYEISLSENSKSRTSIVSAAYDPSRNTN